MADNRKHSSELPHSLRMVAWEVTRSCNLACIHCRASALRGHYTGELTTKEGLLLLDNIASFAKPVIILTGGEPLLREDIYDLAYHGNQSGLRMVLATNGSLVTEVVAKRLIDSGIQRVSISIDGKDAISHDTFRGVSGAFSQALTGIENLKKAGLEFQINTTITKANLHQLQDLLALAISFGAAAHHIFLLVPTGRGKDLADQEISAADYEKTLNWFYEESLSCPVQLKATCAPHYFRIYHQRKKKGPKTELSAANTLHAMTRGCLGGISFSFISHTGQVQPCGYLEMDCGQVRNQPFSVIWESSPTFRRLRDLKQYQGKCGHCEFIKVCGGCRARAYEKTGDCMSEEPLCIYKPGQR